MKWGRGAYKHVIQATGFNSAEYQPKRSHGDLTQTIFYDFLTEAGPPRGFESRPRGLPTRGGSEKLEMETPGEATRRGREDRGSRSDKDLCGESLGCARQCFLFCF